MKTNIVPAIILLTLVGLCLGGLVAVRGFVEPRINAQEQIAQINAERAEAQTETERMFDRQADLAEAAFAANVAIAASGDVAQASMVRSFTSTWWAVAIAAVAIAFIVLKLKGGNGNQSNQNQKVTSEDFANERQRLS